MKQTNNPKTRVGTALEAGGLRRVLLKGEILRADGRPGVRDKYFLVGDMGYQRAAWQGSTDRATFATAGLSPALITKVTKEYARANVDKKTQAVATRLHRMIRPAQTAQDAIHDAIGAMVLPAAMAPTSPASATVTFPPATATATPVTATPAEGAKQKPQVAGVAELRTRESAAAANRGHVLGAWNSHTDYAGTECQKCGAALVVGTPEPATNRQVWGPAASFDCEAWLLRTQNGNAAEYQRQVGDPVPVPEERPTLSADMIAQQVSVAISEAVGKALAGLTL
jgi:type II secretory pathway pseudopilin PulG